ncbi:hypothetical protein CONLIGDRAFT_127363 [Coniochaeta ligniaria NRRL 30616]|uniref:DUF7136 domain-containing protein n=1 Tax=Coniochaeta ligniaria NRRL 30616 TaxID=1408157 RepID=A0A1J7I746_9PEZI|nr:hypothetical protein CONLIGDRAFT_127363 [Coniochaeta ligniaria NRRL 30616]
MMLAPRLLSGLFAALHISYTAAVGLTPGSINIGLVFPLNDTYAPQDGPLPIVVTLSSQPFQPALASTLYLNLTYYLVEQYNGSSHGVTFGHFDLGKLSSSSVDNPHFIIGYSDKLAGRESQFELQCIVSSVVGLPSTDSNSTGDNGTLVTNPNVVFETYFTTQSGARPADVPSSASNGTACLPHGGWYMGFDVDHYVEIKSQTYGVLARNGITDGAAPCAVEVDPATAANITAGMATATTTASSSSSGATGTLSGSGIVASFWSLLVLGLSAVPFVC